MGYPIIAEKPRQRAWDYNPQRKREDPVRERIPASEKISKGIKDGLAELKPGRGKNKEA